MPICEMCGSNVEELYKTLIEGTELNVCKKCSSYGKIKSIIKAVEKKKSIEKEKVVEKEPGHEFIQVIVPNCAELVKKAREKKGMKQKEVAKMIKVKESIIHKIESGIFKPSINLAKKLEKFFKITLIEEHEEVHTYESRKTSEGLTIGDMIKIKKRK